MSATHDTHNWETIGHESDLDRRKRECRERAEAMEAEAANRKAWLEWKRNMRD
jgi:hypothetical protein